MSKAIQQDIHRQQRTRYQTSERGRVVPSAGYTLDCLGLQLPPPADRPLASLVVSGGPGPGPGPGLGSPDTRPRPGWEGSKPLSGFQSPSRPPVTELAGKNAVQRLPSRHRRTLQGWKATPEHTSFVKPPSARSTTLQHTLTTRAPEGCNHRGARRGGQVRSALSSAPLLTCLAV
jgi:hypothetical protein